MSANSLNLTFNEIEGLMKDPTAIACLVNYYNSLTAGAECETVMEDLRQHELLEAGRAILARDPECFDHEVIAKFGLRYFEMNQPFLKRPQWDNLVVALMQSRMTLWFADVRDMLKGTVDPELLPQVGVKADSAPKVSWRRLVEWYEMPAKDQDWDGCRAAVESMLIEAQQPSKMMTAEEIYCAWEASGCIVPEAVFTNIVRATEMHHKIGD